MWNVIAATGSEGFWAGFRGFVNAICRPAIFISLASTVFVLMLVLYKRWTKPRVAGLLFALFLIFYFGSLAEPNYRAIIIKPDNVPITMMVISVMFFIWVAFRRAALNDERLSAGLPLLEEDKDDKVLVWPDLVYTELICLIAATAGLTLWAIISKAPLEQPANPGYAPNPAKAPWYFLGLQEMLVYFDPWMAGVVYPGLIILGLAIMPFIDTNPKGNGYYTLKERPFAIATWLFGFLILWVVLIFFGTFLRGPNWNFFGPYEFWDIHKLEALVNVNLSEYIWVKALGMGLPKNPLIREVFGFVAVLAYLLAMPPLLARTLLKRFYDTLGPVRFHLMTFLLLAMMALPIKMVLRWLFNLKYIIGIPEYFFNI